jgi:hypothetical protein
MAKASEQRPMDEQSLLRSIRVAVESGAIRWSGHAFGRMLERGIHRIQVIHALQRGEVIESYADDLPFPSVLVADVSTVPVHVIVAYDNLRREVHVVTAYRPDTEHFEADLKTRRKK